MVPVEVDEQGNVLDGHHRVRICDEEGISDYPRIVRSFPSEEAKRLHIRALNLLRRHLTPEQRQTVIDDQLRDTPERSDRQIGAALGVHHQTVEARRQELEGRGEIRHVETRTDTRGRQQPAHKPRTAKPTAAGLLATTPEEEQQALALAPNAPDELVAVGEAQRAFDREEREARRAEADRWNEAIALGDPDGSIERATLILRFTEGLSALHRKWFCLDVALLVQAHLAENDPHLEEGIQRTRAFLDRVAAELAAQHRLRLVER
jgi:ParB-like chromosome segregation protein Spo0J